MPAARKATPAAKKAAPAKRATPARSRAAAAPPAEPEEDLLGGLGANDEPEGDDESLDLLSEISEDNGTPWVPWDEDYEDQPEGIQGVVKHVGSVKQDEKYGGGDVPYLEIQDKDDPELLWSVRGYATVLKNQLEKHNPKVGDRIAILYRGEKDNRKGDNTYKDFGVVVRAAR